MPGWSYPSYAWIGLQEKKVTDMNQHGFTKGKPHQNNLIPFYGQVIVSADKGRVVGVVFCDFSKAFNMVSHGILVARLERNGLDG